MAGLHTIDGGWGEMLQGGGRSRSLPARVRGVVVSRMLPLLGEAMPAGQGWFSGNLITCFISNS